MTENARQKNCTVRKMEDRVAQVVKKGLYAAEVEELKHRKNQIHVSCKILYSRLKIGFVIETKWASACRKLCTEYDVAMPCPILAINEPNTQAKRLTYSSMLLGGRRYSIGGLFRSLSVCRMSSDAL